jgi:ribonuclease-3
LETQREAIFPTFASEFLAQLSEHSASFLPTDSESSLLSSLQEFAFKNPHLLELQTRLGHHFHNQSLLLQSLSHSSFSNEMRIAWPSNERLEFLGDAILSSIATSIIYHRFPHLSEGELSKIRTGIVSTASLVQVAHFVDLKGFLLMGKGEMRRGFEGREKMLADAFEAIIGAIAIDAGEAKAKAVVEAIFERGEKLKSFHFFQENFWCERDSKSQLQEILLQRYKKCPSYNLLDSNSAGALIVSLHFNGKELARGTGASRKEIEQRLAKEMLGEIQNNRWEYSSAK